MRLPQFSMTNVEYSPERIEEVKKVVKNGKRLTFFEIAKQLDIEDRPLAMNALEDILNHLTSTRDIKRSEVWEIR